MGARRPRQRLALDVLLSRIMARRWIDPRTGCWIYLGGQQRKGYGCIWDGQRTATVTRVIAEVYLGLARDDSRFVCHHCDIPPCFNPAHLFLGTAATNWADCRSKGRDYQLPPRTIEQAGERNPFVRLTPETVREIREKHAHGASQRSLAREYGVGQPHIWQIVHKMIWKDETSLH